MNLYNPSTFEIMVVNSDTDISVNATCPFVHYFQIAGLVLHQALRNGLGGYSKISSFSFQIFYYIAFIVYFVSWCITSNLIAWLLFQIGDNAHITLPWWGVDTNDVFEKKVILSKVDYKCQFCGVFRVVKSMDVIGLIGHVFPLIFLFFNYFLFSLPFVTILIFLPFRFYFAADVS